MSKLKFPLVKRSTLDKANNYIDTLQKEFDYVLEKYVNTELDKELLQLDFDCTKRELEDTKIELSGYKLVSNVMQFLLEKKEDIRMEELMFNLIEQIHDNMNWVEEFECI